MALLRAILAIVVIALHALPAAASDHPDRVLIEMRAHQLMKWIAERTEYKLIPPPPVVFVRQDVMTRVDGRDTIRALYFPNLMVLLNTFRLGEHDDFLLHELVHHYQFKQGKLRYEAHACYASFEHEAYYWQIKFIEETGIGERPDPMFLATLTCDHY